MQESTGGHGSADLSLKKKKKGQKEKRRTMLVSKVVLINVLH